MKRARTHTMFAVLTTCSLAVLVVQWLALKHAREINLAVEQVLADDALTTIPEMPEARLALASKLSAQGRYDEAEQRYSELIRLHEQTESLGQAARFNLGNSYLRQSLQVGSNSIGAVLPLIELSKQRYRDVLRNDPLHWDARYNLERALRLAPERAAAASGHGVEPVKRVRVIVPDFDTRDLP